MPEANNYIKIGMSSCGIAAGAEKVYNELLQYVQQNNLPVKIQKTGCIGKCYAEPLIEVKLEGKQAVFYQKATSQLAIDLVNDFIKNTKLTGSIAIEDSAKEKKIVLRNCGKIDPEDIEDYIKNQGYEAINIVLTEMGRDKTIEEVKKSGLRGRGGAGFPTWLKWQNCKKENSQEKFIICNADEGDPGAYMDRSVLEGDPHSVIEGMMIAGYAIGATKGFFYIRAEYPLAIERVQKAINQCCEKGLLGNNIANTDFNFDIEIRLGAGAFVCGEETALIASIEGKRGYPRPRPPYPAEQGLWGKPTVINNVETLANIPYIINEGGETYASIGTEMSKGTKVFALTGKINRPGLVEVPMGITIKEIVYELGGGIPNNKKLKAIQTGGPSGGLIPAEYADSKVSYETLQELGSIMGSGGMIVMDEDDCPVDVANFFMKFCVDESCGKCAPCRIGTSQLSKILEKIKNGKGSSEDLEKLEKTCFGMKNASLCGLGQSASNPVLSGLRHFRNEYLEHLNKKCSAKKCEILNK